MKFINANIRTLFRRLLIILVLFSVCRLLFFVFNYTYFSGISVGELSSIFFWGLRFDISTILIINGLFLLFHLFFNYDNKIVANILKYLFFIVNGLAIALNCLDFIYFKFTFKRSTADLLSMLKLTGNMNELWLQFIKDFWLVFIIFLGLIILLIKLYRFTQAIQTKKISAVNRFTSGIVFAIIFFFLARGGTQLKPVGIITAAKYTSSQNIPLLLNTPFTIIKTLEKPFLEEISYFTPEELEKINKPIKKGYSPSTTKPNVVLIIMESLSKEYSAFLNQKIPDYKGYTPFLDSLMQHSLVFTNAFANGKKSIEGIPAITAGIPALMDNPYISSPYSGNRINGIATLLKEQGYSTSFFHGGTNGTMGLEDYSKVAGFEKYFGRKEYNNEAHFDGHWGIYDEEFFQFFSRKLSVQKQPFFDCFFSLSAHHPFTIPEKHKNRFKEGSLLIHKTIEYSDYALSQFFREARKQDWFKNTIFIITADHTGYPASPFYESLVGIYSVPILIYQPGQKLAEVKTKAVQHIDILPTVMNLTSYPKPFFSFGNDMLDTSQNSYAINYINGIYQIIDEKYVLHFDGSVSTALFEYSSDSTLTKNLINIETGKRKELETKVKAGIQTFNNCLLENKMTHPTYLNRLDGKN